MGCASSKIQVLSATDKLEQSKIGKKWQCLLGCDKETAASMPSNQFTVGVENMDSGKQFRSPSPGRKSSSSKKSSSMFDREERDYSHEPMFVIFKKHDTDNDGFLKKGQVKLALEEAGI